VSLVRIAPLGLLGLLCAGACTHATCDAASTHLVVSGALTGRDALGVVTQSDSTGAVVDFGPLGIGRSLAIPLELTSSCASLDILSISIRQPSSVLALDLPGPGKGVSNIDGATAVSFSPRSLDDETAIYALQTSSTRQPVTLLTLRGRGVRPQLVVTPNPLNFGTVAVGQTNCLPLTLLNTTDAAESPMLNPVGSPFSFSPTPPVVPQLAPGASENVSVCFTATSSSRTVSSFSIPECGACSYFSIWLDVFLVANAASMCLAADPPASLDFGYVPVGVTLVQTLHLTNQCLHPLALALLSLRGTSFTLASGAPTFPLTMPPGATIDLPVSFAPARIDASGDELDFQTDDPQGTQLTITLVGEGA
jgi:hypothetical protein